MGSPPMPSRVLIAYDATKDLGKDELKVIIREVRLRGDILRRGDTLVVFGVLHKVQHPLGYLTIALTSLSSDRAMVEEVSKRVHMYVNKLLHSAQECEHEGVDIQVKVTAGTPIKQVILQEIVAYKTTWVIFDRILRRDLRNYLSQIPSKVALIQDNLSVKVLRSHTASITEVIENKSFYSMSKLVPLLNNQDSENIEQFSGANSSCPTPTSSSESSNNLKSNFTSSFVYKLLEHSSSILDDSGSSSTQEKTGICADGGNTNSVRSEIQKLCRSAFQQRSLEAPVLCATCGTKTILYVKESMRFSFSELQLATDDFSKENLLGEGGYGHVYKGELKDGQLIAAKVRKEASAQGFAEFHSEVHVLSFARHKNIVMLLGYCCKENFNILVYEYICNKSLEWHLFDETATLLEWHQRRAIAIGTAKGLRFLHEECRGGPIIHRDMRPSNILLTHDFVPMLGDFGLAKWRTSDDPVHTRILGTLGYLAPEYAENGIVSVRTDVYAFGIVLLQLISGRKVIDSKREEPQQSLRQWAERLIVRLALHELIDPRIEDSYDTYELYLMARTAYLCVQSSPEMRPSMGEVMRLLEGENDHLHLLGEQFIPHYTR